ARGCEQAHQVAQLGLAEHRRRYLVRQELVGTGPGGERVDVRGCDRDEFRSGQVVPKNPPGSSWKSRDAVTVVTGDARRPPAVCDFDYAVRPAHRRAACRLPPRPP
ncbi:MAG: hypothetical protein ABIX12_11230, partial [Rubrivivax sp.]